MESNSMTQYKDIKPIERESIKAQDRELKFWFEKLTTGDIKLPRFQRYEEWDNKRIASLLRTIINNLPLGITLILNVGDKPQFIDRYLETAPQTNRRVTEHLLDGQQRLTAFWRIMQNNYEDITFFVYIPEYDKFNKPKLPEGIDAYYHARWPNNGRLFPMWCDNPKDCLKRGLIRADLLRPGDLQSQIDGWISNALQDDYPQKNQENSFELLEEYNKKRESIKSKIIELREIVSHYNLPFLALPAQTQKDIALDVFIAMNTNSKPLTDYDVIVAEVESVKGESLHALSDALRQEIPSLEYYFDVPELILSVSALLQNKMPNRKGRLDMDKSIMIDNWNKLRNCLRNLTIFLENQGIYDRQRLPTNAVLPVIACLYDVVPDSGDQRGKAEVLLKKYLWSAFFTDRYENSAPTNAYYDYIILKRILTSEKKEDGSLYLEEEVPVLDRTRYELTSPSELKKVGWPKQENIRARAIIAVSCHLKAIDFADGQQITRANLSIREYHHLYPDALLLEASTTSYLALNCALITNTTNRNIGRKDPLSYLKDRYQWTDEDIINQRLNSHLIPIAELANGGYENLSDQDRLNKIKFDFENFLNKRAKLIYTAAQTLCNGRELSIQEVYKEAENQQN